MQQQRLHNQIEQFLQRLNDTNHEGAMHQEEPPQPTEDEEPEETIHVYFVRERDDLRLPRFRRVRQEKSGKLYEGGYHGKTPTQLYERI